MGKPYILWKFDVKAIISQKIYICCRPSLELCQDIVGRLIFILAIYALLRYIVSCDRSYDCYITETTNSAGVFEDLSVHM